MPKQLKLSKPQRNAMIAFFVGGGLFVALGAIEASMPGLDFGPTRQVMPLVLGFGLFAGLQGRAGNRKVPVASDARRAAALAFPTHAGQGWVVVMRDKGGGASVGFDLWVDDDRVAQLMAKRFVVLPLAAGTHRLFADIPGAPGKSAVAPMPITVAEGGIAFLAIRSTMGLTRTSQRLEPVPDTPVLRRALAGMAMVEPDADPVR